MTILIEVDLYKNLLTNVGIFENNNIIKIFNLFI